MNDSLSLVLFSGTADKLHAAGTIAAGAAAMGRPVNVLLMYWALDAFRADRIENDHGLAYDAARPRFHEPVDRVGNIPWLETFRQAKEIGEVSILACSGSLDVLGARPPPGDDHSKRAEYPETKAVKAEIKWVR